MRVAVALLLLLLAAEVARAGPFGRLFHTPEQRAALDALRKNGPQPPESRTVKALPSPEPARLDGYVLRSDGPSTLWINGRPTRLANRESKTRR